MKRIRIFLYYWCFMANIHIDKLTQKETTEMTKPHSHLHYEIYFLLKGVRIYLLDGISFKVEPNSVVVVPPNLLHMTNGGDFERYLIKIAPKLLTDYQKEVFSLFFDKKCHKISSNTMAVLNNCFQQMFSLEASIHYEEKMLSIFSYIVFILEKDLKAQHSYAVDTKNMPPVIFRIIEYINENYTNNISLKTVAEHFNYSVPYIRKAFQKHTGSSLYNYILQTRIKKAKQLLSTTTYSIERVAELSGFSSANYFSLIFKQKENVSPLAYKKLINS